MIAQSHENPSLVCAELDRSDMRLAEMPGNVYLGMYEYVNSSVCRGSPRVGPIATREVALGRGYRIVSSADVGDVVSHVRRSHYCKKG